MNTNDAAETLEWHEKRRARLIAKYRASGKTHFGPRKPEPLGDSWKPAFTPEQQAAQTQYIKANNLPF